MTTQRIAMISITINILLVVVCLLTKLQLRESVGRNNLESTVAIMPAHPRLQNRFHPPFSTGVINNQPSLWSRIHSDDLSSYVRNLRAAGFPEAIVQNIIVTELNQRFAARWAARPFDTNYWRTGPQHNAAQAENGQVQRQLELERRHLIKSLLGVEWYETSAVYLSEDIQQYQLMCGRALPETTSTQLSMFWAKVKDFHDEQRLNDMNTPAIEAQRAQISQELLSELRQILTARDLEEMELQTMAMDVGDVWGAECLYGCILTGAELRELLRIKKGNTSPLLKLFLDESYLPNPDPQTLQDQERRIQMLLGDQRYQGYQRAQDFEFRQIHRSVGPLKGGMEASWAVYDVYQNTRKSARTLQNDLGLTETQRSAALLNLRSQAEASLRQAVGPDQFAAHWKVAQEFIKPFIGEKSP